MDEDITTSHRDVRRCNKANISVQGCVYADINKRCIDKLIENEKRSMSDKMNGNEVLNLLNIAKNSCDSSKRLLVNSQSSISKRHCVNYATVQFNQLNRVHKNGENVKDIESVSKFIVNNDMIKMTQSIMFGDQSGKYQYVFVRYTIIILEPTKSLMLYVPLQTTQLIPSCYTSPCKLPILLHYPMQTIHCAIHPNANYPLCCTSPFQNPCH